MKLSEVKTILSLQENIQIQLPDGSMIPEHFHLTEVGKVTKEFIDCGGTARVEKVVNFQLLDMGDIDHRLKSQKLIKIIDHAQKLLQLPDEDVEVEYQNGTVGRFKLDHDGTNFVLKNKETACLALDICAPKPVINILDFASSNSCTPGGGCC